jgi:hypothetical protein
MPTHSSGSFCAVCGHLWSPAAGLITTSQANQTPCRFYATLINKDVKHFTSDLGIDTQKDGIVNSVRGVIRFPAGNFTC